MCKSELEPKIDLNLLISKGKSDIAPCFDLNLLNPWIQSNLGSKSDLKA
ncbi:hypothetical protein SAAL107622_03815 [Lacicoccus alkaliphilus]|uniref:Uncharacterized protein n=1 Tax=Lacicoccus alkaliphilus DSM 16010 TaxID=1123231 RepID=A0A1M7E0K7_9BACL|nr:hypothetical protein SAMN02745189_01056 [Salinicoccus alkaliphilus DSM 16010]